MSSHLIPYDEKSGLWDENVVKGYKAFMAARAKLLCKVFETEAGLKLFRT
jgi:hypothetical protein